LFIFLGGVVGLQSMFTLVEYRSLTELNRLVNVSYDKHYMINSFAQNAKFNFGLYNRAVVKVLDSLNDDEFNFFSEEMNDEMDTLLSDIQIIEERIDSSSNIHELDVKLLAKIGILKKKANKLIMQIKASKYDRLVREKLIHEWVNDEFKGEVFEDFDSLSDVISEKGYTTRELIKERTRKGYEIFLLFSIVFICFVLFLFFLIKFNVLNPIKKMTDDFEVISKGHYEMEVEVRDELTEMGRLGASFNILLSNFHNSLLQVEHASKSKDQFMANISHELRTPLNAILGFSKLLLSDSNIVKTGKGNTEALREIHNSGKHLLSLINDILDYNKIKSSNFEINPSPGRLLEIVTSSINLVKVKANEKDIDLLLDQNFDSKLVVLIDELRVKQVLLNLLSNAIKFTEEGAVVLRVIATEEGQNAVINFTVEDSGIGMDENGLSKIFDFYGQAEASTQAKFGGTGLGLPISKSLVERMGGEIEVESEIGRGSRFSFSLCLEKLPESLAPSPIEAAFSLDKGLDIRELKVMLAEDNLVNQKLFLAMMKNIGLKEIEVVENGLIAFEKSQSDNFDIIFMDMQMPVMSGIEATKKIIEHLGENSPPIFALTANNFSEDRTACEEAGMAGFLTKPIEIEELRTTLNDYVQQDPEDSGFKFMDRGLDPVLNDERIDGLIAFDLEMVKNMLELFIVDSQKVLEGMEKARGLNDFNNLSARAHRIRGSLINLGGDFAAHIAERIEIGEGDMALNIKRLKQSIEVFIEKFKEKIEKA